MKAMWSYQLQGDPEQVADQLELLWEAGCLGLEEGPGWIRGYFEAPAELSLGGTWQQEPDVDWQEAWKQGLEPLQVAGLTIAPSWRRPPPGTEQLILDPGQAFGTGHHASTRLALELMLEAPLAGKDLLDLGSGSGILALAAARRGARCLGLDTDPQAVAVARENAAINSLPAEFRAGQLASLAERPSFDVLVANLFAELHADLLPGYLARLRRPGVLIMSGILAERCQIVLGALRRAGPAEIEQREEGGWVALRVQR